MRWVSNFTLFVLLTAHLDLSADNWRHHLSSWTVSYLLQIFNLYFLLYEFFFNPLSGFFKLHDLLVFLFHKPLQLADFHFELFLLFPIPLQLLHQLIVLIHIHLQLVSLMCQVLFRLIDPSVFLTYHLLQLFILCYLQSLLLQNERSLIWTLTLCVLDDFLLGFELLDYSQMRRDLRG